MTFIGGLLIGLLCGLLIAIKINEDWSRATKRLLDSWKEDQDDMLRKWRESNERWATAWRASLLSLGVSATTAMTKEHWKQ